MVHTAWQIRDTDEEYDVEAIYGNDPTFFSLKINHVGMFTKSLGRSYVNGKVNYVDLIDCDVFYVHEINAIMVELGYNDKEPIYYHFKVPDSDLDFGLRALGNDKDVLNMVVYVPQHKLIEAYTEHWKTNLTTYFKPPDSKVVIEEIEVIKEESPM